MDSEWVVTVLVALAAALLIGVAIWVLNGPNRRRVADLEQRLAESRRRSGLGPADGSPGRLAPSARGDDDGRSPRGDSNGGDPNAGDPNGDDATVIDFRPRAADRTIERLKHELAVVRDELLRWRAMSDDFERRWRAELTVSEELRDEVAERRAAEAEVRRSLEDVRAVLEQLVDEGGSAEVDPEPSIDAEPAAVIDLRDPRSHLEDRLQRLEADLDAVRRDLELDDD